VEEEEEKEKKKKIIVLPKVTQPIPTFWPSCKPTLSSDVYRRNILSVLNTRWRREENDIMSCLFMWTSPVASSLCIPE
jgi:hypothetical protein